MFNCGGELLAGVSVIGSVGLPVDDTALNPSHLPELSRRGLCWRPWVRV